MDMTEKFFNCFRKDVARKCEQMTAAAREGSLTASVSVRMYERWMGMLEMASDLGCITFDDYCGLSDAVFQIRLEALHDANMKELGC